MGSSSSCPPSISYSAVANLGGYTPVSGDTEAADSANQQIISDNVPPLVQKLFVATFHYNPNADPQTTPSDIYISDPTVAATLKGFDNAQYWYTNDDVTKGFVSETITTAFDALGLKELYTPLEKKRLVKDIEDKFLSLFNLQYSVWDKTGQDTFYCHLIDEKYRARIDIAYYAYHGKDVSGTDGVYVILSDASYVAQYHL